MGACCQGNQPWWLDVCHFQTTPTPNSREGERGWRWNFITNGQWLWHTPLGLGKSMKESLKEKGRLWLGGLRAVLAEWRGSCMDLSSDTRGGTQRPASQGPTTNPRGETSHEAAWKPFYPRGPPKLGCRVGDLSRRGLRWATSHRLGGCCEQPAKAGDTHTRKQQLDMPSGRGSKNLEKPRERKRQPWVLSTEGAAAPSHLYPSRKEGPSATTLRPPKADATRIVGRTERPVRGTGLCRLPSPQAWQGRQRQRSEASLEFDKRQHWTFWYLKMTWIFYGICRREEGIEKEFNTKWRENVPSVFTLPRPVIQNWNKTVTYRCAHLSSHAGLNALWAPPWNS